MGLLRWLRGGDENDAAANAVSAGLAELDALFRPSKHKQTEHVEESKRRRVDAATGQGVDLDRGVAVIRTRRAKPEGSTPPPQPAQEPAPPAEARKHHEPLTGE
jgi:hypothetical protein